MSAALWGTTWFPILAGAAIPTVVVIAVIARESWRQRQWHKKRMRAYEEKKHIAAQQMRDYEQKKRMAAAELFAQGMDLPLDVIAGKDREEGSR